MVVYTLSDLAYTKVIVHSLKYPHARVNGVLLGTNKGKEVEVSDAVPLLHHWTSLSPMMEIGLDLTKTYAAGRALTIVGYYEASEYVDEGVASLGKVGERVTSKIREGFTDALAIVVDSAKLGQDSDPALIPYTATSSGAFGAANPSTLQLSDAVITRALDIARNNALSDSFGDFDDHLENIRIDWLRNGAVQAALEKR
ncbi:hypothetical protein K488DRAFT_55102 [Vararia minispora EC-137]|uniref:Uncharacterized protein n=1 Tax=Vararia minispora EC-137 TaxID=1314806 RepID=A0ACB8QEK6_9AGAM|nr:hypothetical protein K488DRAFT_55102 [Vararia minispora EC-137]